MQEAGSFSLPGQDAQYRAVPPNRPRTSLQEARQNPEARTAAVLALLHPIENQTHVALIRRNTYPGVHSGQISFPGGKVEESDSDLIHTATRETHEEVGVSSDHYSIWGELTQVYIPPSRFLVQPVVGLAEHELQFTREEREVEEILHAPLTLFTAENTLVREKLDVGGFKVEVPVFKWDGHIIWGATAMMLSELGTLINSISESSR